MKYHLLRRLFISLIGIFSLLLSYGQARDFQFAWLTDIHIVRGSKHIADLKASVDDINRNPDVQFTIVSGDISDFGYSVDLKIAKEILDQLKKPYYILQGNHDTKWSESGGTSFQDIFGYRNIAFDFGNVSFIGFQTAPILRRGDGYITAEDIQWLSQQLQKAKEKNNIIIAFTHYPLNRSMSNWYRASDLLKASQVPVVLVGHGHRNRAMDFDGLPGVMARTNPSSKRGDRVNPVGYTMVRLEKDSIYFTEVNPEIGKRTTWHQMSQHPASYELTNHRPDLSINANYPAVRSAWKVQLPAGVTAAACYDEGRIMVGDRSGVMHCLDEETGKTLWTFQTGKSIFSTPAVEGKRMVFGSADGNIYCLDKKTGQQIWVFKTDKWVLGSPAIKDGTVFIGGSDGKFRAIDLKTGRQRWAYADLHGWIETTPVVYQNKVFFGCWDNRFYALDQQTGQLVWQWALSESRAVSAYYAPAACVPVVSGNRVFIAGPDQILTALDATTGKAIWRTLKQPRVNEALGISSDGSKVYVKATKGDKLFAYRASEAEPQLAWQADVPGEPVMDDNQSAITEKDGKVYFTLRSGLAICTAAEDGKILWQHKLGDVMQNPATPISSNSVLLSDIDGNLTLLRF